MYSGKENLIHSIEFNHDMTGVPDALRLFLPQMQNDLHRNFSLCLEQMNELLETTKTIHLNMVVPSGSANWLALYDVRQSSEKVFIIHFNLVIFNFLWSRNERQYHDQLVRSIIHELVHALDHQVVKESIHVYHSKVSSFETKLNTESHFWPLMNYFSLLRNEGIATFGEMLFLNEENKVVNETWQDDFIKDLKSFSCNLSGDRTLAQNSIPQIEKNTAIHGCHFIHSLFLEDLSKRRRSDILYELMKMDLSEWLQLFVMHQSEKVRNAVLELFSELGTRYQNVNFHTLLQLKDLEVSPYISAISRICVNCLTIKEIELKLSKHLDQSRPEDLTTELKARAEYLIKSRNRDTAQIIDWALSYFLQDEGLMHDELPFIGFMDDWFVLDSALNQVQRILEK